MSRSLKPSSSRAGANHLGPKKGSMPKPHQSPGRAAGSGPTPTAGVSPKRMGKPAGNSKGRSGGGMLSGAQSPMLGHNKC